MTPTLIALMAGAGLATGIFAGVFGVGGGVILVPILILGFKYTQQAAIGTSLVALLLPVGLLGVIQYYHSGKLSVEEIKLGLVIAIGLFFGTFFGAKIGSYLPALILQRAFAVFLVVIAVKLWLISPSG
jgi:uncharacterized membrane protein YfcA